MKILLSAICLVFLGSLSWAKTLSLPQGKGRCPPFSFEADKDWDLKSDRKLGDRWLLLDSSNRQIARFDYKLSHTDQKQLSEVELKQMNLGSFKVEKYTVTTSFPEDGATATEGLITSYTFLTGRLKGLVIMSPTYSKSSGHAEKIEKLIKSIK